MPLCSTTCFHGGRTGVPGIQGSVWKKDKAPLENANLWWGSLRILLGARETELTLKHLEEFLTGMIHYIKTPHRWIMPPWDLISPDILHSITWAPSDDSIESWVKEDHDVPQNKISTPSSTSLPHSSNMPPLYLSIGHMSQKDFWKGKDNLPVQNSHVPWLQHTKHTSKETGCPISMKCYPQINYFQSK